MHICYGSSALYKPDVYKMSCMFSFPQTIFEINSNNKSSGSEVMRAKRSRDDRLLDKFSKARAERIVQSAVPAVTRTEPQHEEDEELQVSFRYTNRTVSSASKHQALKQSASRLELNEDCVRNQVLIKHDF